MQAASTSGRTMGYSSTSAVARSSSTRRVCSVRVQAVATTAGTKTVLTPPYNVLITGSTKGVCMSLCVSASYHLGAVLARHSS